MEIKKISDKLAIIASQQVKEREYWFEAMSGEPVKSFFYYDYKEIGDIDGDREKRRMEAVRFQLSGALFERLMQLSNRYDYTLYMALVCGLIVLLDKYTYGANKDILIGAPIYKQETEMDFINTVLPLRNRLYEGITFKNLLLQVKDTLVEADKHQNFPIEAILEYLNMSPTEEDFPLFDIAILLKNIQDENYLRDIPVNMVFSLERTENGIDGKIEYNISRFRHETVEGIADHYIRVLEKALANIDEQLANIDILSEQEKKQLLVDFNATEVEYPEEIPIHRLFEEQAARVGDRVAVVGNSCFTRTGMVSITYRHLDEKSLQVARHLHEKGVTPGPHESIVGIMSEDSPEILAGILAILRAGGAYLPISPHYPEARQKYLVNDCNITIILTDSRETDHFFIGTIIEINDPGIYRGGRDSELPVSPESSSPLAYIIYTSGSTGNPKGSLIRHKSVVRLVKNTNFIALKEEDRILKTGAMEFDASTFEIWGALLNGLQLYLERKDIILAPEKLKERIIKSKITVIWMTSPLFNQVADADIETFSGLSNLLVGGDVLSPPHIYRVRKRFPGLNIINGYGPTENTTFSATHLIEREYKGRIPIGRPIANSTVYIVDTGFCLVPPGAVGEVVVGGEGVARGYLNNPELTNEKFRPLKKAPLVYRTGDLARWLHDGTIDFLGRIDFQVKIRGFRVEIGEIESRLMNHEDIREAVVIARQEQTGLRNQYYLASYIVGAREFEPPELRKYLSRDLPDYMIPGYFITLPKMPLTANGKIDRKALPEPELKAGEGYIPPSNDVEEKLAEIWSETLGITKHLISVKADFFDLGGHSLRANEVVSEIHRHFNVKIPLIEIFSTPTIRGLAQYIAAAVEERYAAIKPAEKREYYKLSPAQKRLYILHQVEPDSIVYNMPQVVPFTYEPDKEKLNRVFKELIKRHESLRTSFEVVGEEPVQRIHEAMDFTIRYDEIDKNQAQEVIDRFMEPFDLTRAPLMKAVLLNIKSQGYLLLLDLHHIIADGASLALLTEEFNRIYGGKKGEPEPLRLQYKDYSCWQYSDEHQTFLKKQETYWLEVFPDEIPVLDLPIDYSRPPVQSFEGNTIEVEVGEEPSSRLKRLAHEEGATLYMVLLALFNVFLSRPSGQDDIIIGTPVSGRRHSDMQGIMGMFVNTLAIRNFPCTGKSFKDFLQEVKSRTVEAFENQEYPFEELVEKIKVHRDPGRNPLFDVMFALERIETGGLADSGRRSPEVTLHYRIAKFDLTLTAMETPGPGPLVLSFEYCSRLFKEETMRRFIDYFRRILGAAAEYPELRLEEIPMVGEEEQKRILYEFNDTAAAYDEKFGVRMLMPLFQQQVERTPFRTAVVFGHAHLGYDGLDKQANQLAFILRQKGVGPDTIVGVLADRSLEMIIMSLAVLKAGGAYLPLDPDYPQERIQYMLEDSNAKILLGMEEWQKKIIVNCQLLIVNCKLLMDPPQAPFHHSSFIIHHSCQLAYVIYTSGTTGKPKGVMIDHANAAAYVQAFLKEFPLGPADIVILEAAFIFDVFAEEVYPPLVSGAKVCVAQKEVAMDIHLLGNFIARNNITHFTSPPLLLNELNRLENLDLLRSIHTFISGVDVLKEDHISRLRALGSFYNVYGPTEATVSAAYYKLPGEVSTGISIPIGKPITNYRIYILDKNGMLQGIGIPGEICIAGDGVGRGYLNNPELTAEKFYRSDRFLYRSYRSYRTNIFYKTGDLGRWLPCGNIEFLGRIDLQLKIRGFRVEPGEIENVLRTIGGIKDAVVTARKEGSGEMSICAYITADDSAAVDMGELRDTLSRYLPAYMMPAYFVSLKKIPLTPSGKVDKRALQEPGAGIPGVIYSAPRNSSEITLVRLWSAVLGVEKEMIGIDANFFHLGGHSLKANLLAAKINKELGIKIPLVELFRTPSIRGLAEFIKTAEKTKYSPINAAEKKVYYPLSSAQKRLFVLQQLAPLGVAYHMTTILGLEGGLDIEKLEECFRRLVRRHESLRTSFEVIEGEPAQKIHDEVEFEIEYLATDVHGQTRTFLKVFAELFSKSDLPEAIIKSFIRPFDLSRAPLLRVGLIKEKVEEETYILVVDMHHIIGDGTSTAVLVAEFMAIYEGKELPELRLHYKDYVQWENYEKEGGAIRQHEVFWLNEFSDEIPVLELPADYPRPKVQDYEGSTLIFELGVSETRGLKHMALTEGATLYMVLLAVYNIFLSRLSGQETIVVGTPTSGRPHADLERIIGMFVNTLILKNEPIGEKTFRKFLKEVKEKTLAAFTHQDYPYDELVKKITAARDSSRNPLFDAMFILQNLDAEEFEIPGLKLTPYPIKRTTSKFDLTLEGIEGDEHLTYIIEYSTRLFKKETIERFISYLEQLTAAVLEKSDQKICRLDMLPETEKERLVVKFNDTAQDFPGDKTIYKLFEEQVDRYPDQVALVFKDKNITYRDFDGSANRLANYLIIKKGFKSGDRAAVLMGRSLEVIISLMGVLKAGGAYIPLDPLQPVERLRVIFDDAAIDIVLSQQRFREKLTLLPALCRGLPTCLYIDEPATEIHAYSNKRPCVEDADNPAYIMYTSGSSGIPKGVLVEHRTIVNTLIWRKNFYEYRPGDASLQNPPYFFDSSVTDIFTPLLGGARLVLIQENERMDLAALKKVIITNRVTHFIAVPAFYNVMVEEIGDGLKSVRMVCVAGEHFPDELVKKHFDRLPQVRIFNEYGPTENSVNSTAFELKPNSEKAFIGKPIDNVQVYILDRTLCLCPIGVTGEICLAGSSLARGYLNNPELTAKSFFAHELHELNELKQINKSFAGVEGGLFQKPPLVLYKTGDLAQWSLDGNLEFVGRADSQVKIRGIRVEVAEIENHLMKRDDIKEAIVLAHESPHGDKYLCAYVVMDGSEATKVGKDEWKSYLAERLPEYMIPSHILVIEAIPFTPSGKIDRRNLPIPEFSGEDFIGPRDMVEEQLVEIWANVLGTREENIGIDADFFQLGGHSLRATSVVSRIHKVFNVKIPLTEIFVTPTIRGLAKYIKDAGEAFYASIEPVEKKEYYPLSPAQKRLYILHRMEPGGVGYNMPEMIPFPGKIDMEKLEWTFKELLKRHETLRTSFEMVEEQPVQRIYDAVDFKISRIQCQGLSLENIQEDFVRPFDLSQAPLLRVGLIKPGCTTLLIDLHHIITDGTSQAILTREFKRLYAGEKGDLPQLRLQYKDYSQWRNSEKQRALIKGQETYWLEIFSDEPPVLNLPFDYPRPLMQSFQGKTVEFRLSVKETQTLKLLARESQATLYMSILAVFNVLLAKLSGQEDIVVGTPIAGRRHADLDSIIGMFINTLALRNKLPGEMRFKAFLGELKARTLEAFENQEYPFEELVEKVSVKRDTGRNPLFDTMFNLLNQQEYAGDIGNTGEATEEVLNKYKHNESTSKFDMTLTAVDLGERLFLAFEYCSRLFEPATIERFITYFTRILYLLTAVPDLMLHQLEIITEEEKKQILYEFNDTNIMYPVDSTIHGLFVQQVERTPDHIAVFGLGRTRTSKDNNMPMAITYRELNEKSSSLAAWLMESGVTPDTIVAIMMERTIEMMIVIYGILKAGGAYLPIAPDFPQERIDFIRKDSAAKILLTANEIASFSTGYVFNSHHSSFNIRHSSQLAYAIYTSGSTGKPKGVIIGHGNVVNFFLGMSLKIDFSPGKTILALTTITFDIFVLETLLPLAKGLKLIIVAETQRQDPISLEKTIAAHCIDMLQFTPSRLKLLLDSGEKVGRLWPNVKELVVGGEAFPEPLFEIVRKRFHGKIYNVYGPTETSVWSTLKDLTGMGKIDIGAPIANTCVYIVDKYNTLQPVGAPGELCIGGSGVARGYLNRPELTAEKFYRSYMSNKTYIVYRTGDLARWLPGGNIEFLGRIDHQIKIRGFRIEPGEIENQLLNHDKIKDVAVVVKEIKGGDNYLCAYIVCTGNVGIEELREYLSQSLPDYMIPSYFITIEKIPLNPNGKIDRQALPMPEIIAGENYCAPRNTVEEKAAEIWAEVLHIEKNIIGIDANFFQLGGHSLSATIMIAKIHKELGVALALGEFFKKPTIRGLAGTIIGSNPARYAYRAAAPAEKREYYPLSPAQKRLYLLHLLDREGTVYNLPFIMTLEGNVQIKKITGAFQRLIKRHESLRTSFIAVNNEPVQKIHDNAAFEIEQIESREQGAEVREAIIYSFIRPFDLSCAPLLRVGLINTGENRYVFMTDIHHIIADGFSIGILIKEFMALYEGRQLPELKLQYKDYSEWKHNEQISEISREQENFWLKEFEGEIPVLELPTDYARPAVKSFEGSIFNFEIDGRETKGLKTIALEAESTLYMVLLAVYDIFLAKLNGRESIVVGTVTAGRSHADLENTIGMFVNTLALRNEPAGEKNVKQFLKEVKKKTLEAIANQDYQYDKLVERVVVARDTGRNPIFDTLFTLQTQDVPEMEIPGLKLKPFSNKHSISKFDLTLLGMEINDTLSFVFEYCTKLFRMETVERFAGYFQRIISGVLEKPDVKIAEIEIISEKEKEHILFVFNDTDTDYPREKAIHRLFEEQALAAPDRIAVVDTGIVHGISITYNELNTQAGLLAGVLIEKGIVAGDVTAIIGGRSLEMVKGILGILKAGAAYLPIDVEYPPERIDYMLKDSGAAILLTDYEKEIIVNCQLLIVNCKLMSPPQAPLHHSSFIVHQSSHLAYVIYTSGSTGKPKGVMVTHRNVVRLVKNTNFVAFGLDTRILQTGAPVFDASTFEIWGSLLNGGQLVLALKETILDAALLGWELNAHGVNTLWLSAPLFNQLLQQDIEMFAPLRYLIVGGDVLSPEHINKVRRRFPLLRVINGYGPTENTTFSLTHLIDADYSINIPIGRPISNSTAYIIDKNDRLQPVGIYGELVVGGEGVALGYMNNPELTSEKFSDLHHSSFIIHHLKLYRTGDLVRWLSGGNIEFLGRIDRQVKIRGFRVEPGEIENRLLNHDKIKDAAVVVNEIKDGKYLCAYIVCTGNVGIEELREYLSQTLPDYMIPSYFITIGKIPLNPNGKIDRQALPTPEITAGENYCAPRNVVEERAAEIWAEVLHIGKNVIGIDTNFFQLGGHSLSATIMIAKIHKELDLTLSLGEFFKKPTIRGLAGTITESNPARYAYRAALPVEKREYYPLSPAQKRLYMLHLLDREGTVYNIPSIMTLEGTVQIKKITGTFQRLIKRHESLRTSFIAVNNEPVQKIHDNAEFEIEQLESREQGAEVREAIIKSFIRPFDLSCAPLLRVGLLNTGDNRYVFMTDIHHIISDGFSMGILIREFMALFEGRELPELKLQYKDYWEWKHYEQVSEISREQENFWLKEFEGEIPVLELPTDYLRPAVQSFEGSIFNFEIDGRETKGLKTIALEEESTLYMVLFVVYDIFLAKLTGREAIVVGTVTAGRSHADLENIIGMFVNTLALRNEPAGEKNVKQFLKEVKEKTLEAFANQDYQYDELVERVVVARDTGRNPIFDTLFTLQTQDVPGMEIPGLKLKPFSNKHSISKFDLTLLGMEINDTLSFVFEYCTKLFRMETVERFAGYFRRIISGVLEKPDVKIAEIEIISEEEKEHILFVFNNTDTDYPRERTIHRLFEEQALAAPDRIAVVDTGIGRGISITYNELNTRAGLLAGILIEKGIIPGDLAAIIGGRSLEMVKGFLGILKAGAAYLPIDVEYPPERIDYMLKDSGAAILLTDYEEEIIVNCKRMSPPQTPLHHSSFIVHHSSHLAYVIYTSGSTGQPKGVIVTHRNVVRLVKNTNYVAFGLDTRILQTGAPVFDATTFEIWGSLLNGGQLVLAAKEAILDAVLLGRVLNAHGVNTLWLSAPLFKQLLQQDIEMFAPLHYLIVGGDVLSPEHINKVRHRFPLLRVINGYGPTENTTFSVTHLIDTDYSINIPIGRPISNSTAYIVHKNNRLQPVGIYGELVVGGDGVALGYMNNPELTSEKFIDLHHSSFIIHHLKLYRTGDLARWRPNGDIDFLGRIDRQVKIRGFRVEPGEIENLLLARTEIKDAVVSIREREDGEKYLAAYIVLHPSFTSTDSLVSAGEQLRDYLSSSLPDYMIPSYFVTMDKIPLTANGKVDRNALPEPGGGEGSGQEYAPPGNEVETKLVEIWSELLGIKKDIISINADFFRLGGHSLKAAAMMTRIQESFDIKLDLVEIFSNPTVRKTASLIKATQLVKVKKQEMAGVNQEIEELVL